MEELLQLCEATNRNRTHVMNEFFRRQLWGYLAIERDKCDERKQREREETLFYEIVGDEEGWSIPDGSL